MQKQIQITPVSEEMDICINLKDQEVKEAITGAKRAYQRFAKKFIYKLDLKNPNSIKEIYHKAKEMGIFEKAKNIRELVFGKNIAFYGVVYLWDQCCNYCIYCPGSIQNRAKAIKQGGKYPLRELSVKEAIKDTRAVMKDGHKHICYLTGEWPERKAFPKKLVPYLKAFDKLGLKEIILNIPPQTIGGFGIMRSAVKKTALQFRVFQETYNKEVYSKVHIAGPKSDYRFRIKSQARALRAGFDNVGIGTLFGLNRYPIEEINGLQNHAEMLNNKYRQYPAKVCLPSANFLERIGVTIPYILERGKYDKYGELIKPEAYELFSELIYALARLAMPTISIVSSERDPPGLLKILDSYATCTTLNVHPGVGDNIKCHRSDAEKCKYKSQEREIHFEQVTTFPRNPKITIENMKRRGYTPLLRLTK